ncbi:peptidoglycan/xylan/chitin deacetylase (PgdA/CDA1 family) [Krasilnikovia cinnamomea]|uniref:Peptidoglycan/xylan/chitin deacetylase (PgdA/CDA1 family) n=1 Tax=Krasilnikovia cinnamomea TaxID=349313 RepID=A0A4V2G7Y5_9ACTN|nr:polysaccharide deacetylase family protein [Krasilnikovia cinnamomea]RZU54356.1 peptidoglycan/xylan/chitin deacetylase (PgdA/CDA1 family) [Krasilnikovia cinnamomea]
MGVPVSRRGVLRGALLAAGGAGAGVFGTTVLPRWFGWDQPPVTGGYAAAADNLDAVAHPEVPVRYYVQTTEPVVAFTFDDGPGPQWTPMVLDILERERVPATFFMVGRQLAAHADLVRGRLAGHEVGNHSWGHEDLATLDLAQIRANLGRTHEMIRDVTGQAPTLLRPPFGHLGGSTLLAADAMGYDVVLWSYAMHERRYRDDPGAQVRDVVDNVRPGAIILAHDLGDERRLVTIRGLSAMIAGLRARGFRFATVSQLVSGAAAPGTPPPGGRS